MNQPTEKQLRIWTAEIAKSDRNAFEQLFRLMYPRLVQFACKYTQNKPEASDIVQDAFVILWEKRRQADPQRSLKAYLYKIVRNRSLNHLRDHSNRTVGLDTLAHLPSTAPSDAPVFNSDELEKLIPVWVDDLPGRRREAFELSRFEGLKHDEIAQVMGISSHTVNNHIVAALQYLRDCYETYQEENG